MIERLITVPERNARAALEECIHQARYDCAAFGTELDFDNPMWDVTETCPRPTNKSASKSRFYFTTHEGGTSKSMKGRVPLAEPFASFIKAIIRLKQDGSPQTADPLMRIVNASRDLAEGLQERGSEPCLLLGEDFDVAARKVVRRATGATAYRLGCALQEIAEFIDKRGITPIRLDWSNPIKKKGNSRDRTSDIAVKAAADKIPDADVLDAIAEIWNSIDDPSDIILMGSIVLMHCAPWRIVEVLRIVRNCEIEDQKQGPNGAVLAPDGLPVMRYGIRYWKEKSGEPDIKWIPTVMVDVAKNAIARIREATTDANQLAKWLHNHPGRAFLPCDDDKDEFTVKDVQTMFGFSRPPAALTWLRENKVSLEDHVRHQAQFGEKTFKMVKRGDLEAALLRRSPAVSAGAAEAPLHERMFLTFANQHHATRATNPCQLEITNDQHVRDFLGGRTSKGETIIESGFSRLLNRPDLSARSHQFRHWLNTLAQAGGLEQMLVARWSGREEIEQNAEYDHLTPTQLAETLREPLANGMAIGVLADIHTSMPPVEQKDFRDTVIATAHVTEIGFCIHDWNASACPEFGACITCASFVFTKGDTKHRERTAQMRVDTAWIIENLKAEMDEGTRLSSTHLLTMVEKLASIDRILAYHDDQTIPDGTLIQPNSASPVHHRATRNEAA